MSNIDYYFPQPLPGCPVCHTPLSEWQGSDGPGGFFVWQQGVGAPLDQRVEAAARVEADVLAKTRLPNVFRIYTSCCSRHFMVEAIGRAPNGTWSSTELITARDAQRHEDERMEHFKARLQWLRGGHR